MEVIPPHCHRATSVHTNYDRFQNATEIKWYVFYFRFKIWNKGNVSAKNVEVILKDVKNEKNEFINLSIDNLLWSSLQLQSTGTYIKRIYWDYISPKTYQYSNLGYIVDPNMRNNLKDEYDPRTPIDINETCFAFSIYWRTPDYRYLIPKGKYVFEIIAGCENGKSTSEKFILDVTGYWSEDEKEMLNKGINIKVA